MFSKRLIIMREEVKKELEQIPKGNMYQNWMRQVYFNARMHSLGKKSTYPDDKNEILKLAIKEATKFAGEHGKTFTPQYDKNFFKI